MRSNLFGENREQETNDRFTLQNERMLRISVDGEVYARQGSMVAYQGGVVFDYQGTGSIGKFLKKALTGEGVPLMKVSGRGDLFLAHNADEVHLLHLDNEAVTVSGQNLLAFDAGLQWDVRRLEGATMFAGGFFNTVISGTGWVALTSHGTPVVLRTDVPTFADAQAAIAWSANLGTRVQTSFKLGALIGRGSGEAFQIAFSGDGFVIVQASEGPVLPPHSHG